MDQVPKKVIKLLLQRANNELKHSE